MAIHVSGANQLMWREVEDGQLPSPRIGLRAAVVDDIIYVTAGDEGGQNYLTSILYWDPSAESWEVAGDLSVARAVHAAVSLPYSIIESGCSASTTASPTTFTPGMIKPLTRNEALLMMMTIQMRKHKKKPHQPSQIPSTPCQISIMPCQLPNAASAKLNSQDIDYVILLQTFTFLDL